MSAEPLTREEQDRIVAETSIYSSGWATTDERWRATVQAAEERAEALRAALANERERAIPRRDFGLINRIDAALVADDEARA